MHDMKLESTKMKTIIPTLTIIFIISLSTFSCFHNHHNLRASPEVSQQMVERWEYLQQMAKEYPNESNFEVTK